MRHSPSIPALLLALAASAAVAGGSAVSQELDVAAAMGPESEARLTLPAAANLFETRQAGRVLARFPAGREVIVLAMDAHGLKVQAQGPHGPLRGWVSRKVATDDRPEANAALEAWYRRELSVAALQTRRQAALNLTPAEMVRIFGAPTRRTLSSGGPGLRSEILEWIRTEKLDLNKALGGALIGIDKDSPLAHPEAETGRLTAECREGIVVALGGTLEPGKPTAATEISPPLPCPFAVKPIPPIQAARRAGD